MSEQVVLLSEDGRAVGTEDKATVHHTRTPLHLAFSCYVFDDDGRLLVTRRASSKTTWPGVRTNSFCGHPAPGESATDAVRRRGAFELGLDVGDVRLALPAFRYIARMDNGFVENELCPVFVTFVPTGTEPVPNGDEVDDTEWVPWADLSAQVADGTAEVSPWCAEQVSGLSALGDVPTEWPDGDATLLPPALREAGV